LTNLQELNCNTNKLTELDLTGLDKLTTFDGRMQTYSLDFTGSPGNYTGNVAFGAGATFDNTALSYSNGILTSTSNTALTSGFTSPTGLSDYALTGTLTMTYPSVIAVTGVSLNKTSVSMEIGSTEQLTATVLPSDATNKNVTWKSSNTSIATVSATGLITALAEGTALINVTTEESAFANTCYVTVKRTLSSDATLAGLTISQGSLTPAFSPDITEYTVEVANDVTSINLSAAANDAAATIDGAGTKTLSVGENVFSITVTAENGDVKVYTVTVYREEATIETIAVTGVSLDQTSVSMKIGESAQLTATVLPENATNKNVTWSSSNSAVATVSADGLISAGSEGSATITVTTADGGFKATCNVDVSKKEIEVEEETPVGEDGTGKMVLSLTVPADVLFSGSFRLTLPKGVQLDLAATKLADELVSQLSLTIVQNTDGSWLFTLAPILRNASEMVYSRIVEIGYIVDETVAEGKHEAIINELSFEFENGTTIVENELPVTITVNAPTGIPGLLAKTIVSGNNGRLYIQSPASETIRVYSVNGVLLHNFQKTAGSVDYPIGKVPGSVLIVKGGSGWVKKVVL